MKRCLGHPEHALKRSQQALALAREFDHPFTLADVLTYGGCMFDEMRRDAHALKDNAERLMRLSNGRVPSCSSTGTCFPEDAAATLGQVSDGIAPMREGMAAMESMGVRCYLSEALRSLAEALALVEETDDRHWEAELCRLRAQLSLLRGQDAEAEVSPQKAVQVAHCQQAKSWQLRATVSLCRVLQKQAKQEEARQLLAEMYTWFTEGFDTPHLKDAQVLLQELS